MVQKYDYDSEDKRAKNEEIAAKKLVELIRLIVEEEVKKLHLESTIMGTVSSSSNGTYTVNLGGNNNITVDKSFADVSNGSTVTVKSTNGNLGSSYIDKALD